ncbi:hypothetical protein BKA69DRAFT_1123797 [Paraphysoderma sedebokerense]|nr:hypothetical protein BKA69DRAFT_1123797 [Paraphysoderma sedebokerense]
MIGIAIGMSLAIQSTVPSLNANDIATIPIAPVGFADSNLLAFILSNATLSKEFNSVSNDIRANIATARSFMSGKPVNATTVDFKEFKDLKELEDYQYNGIKSNATARNPNALQLLGGYIINSLPNVTDSAISMSHSIMYSSDVQTPVIPAYLNSVMFSVLQSKMPMMPNFTAAVSGGIDPTILSNWFSNVSSKIQQGDGVPPWIAGFNTTFSSFPVQQSDVIVISVSIVPPFVVYGLYFLLSFFTELLARERISNQLSYLITNTLSSRTYYLVTLTIFYFFYLLPVAVTFIALTAFQMKWFTESSILNFLLLSLPFGVAIATQSAILSFFFGKTQSVGPVLSFGSAIVIFVPYFIVEFASGNRIELWQLIVSSVFLPAFGFYRSLHEIAEQHRLGRPFTITDAVSFSKPILPLCLIFIAQAVLGLILIFILDHRNQTGSSILEVIKSVVVPSKKPKHQTHPFYDQEAFDLKHLNNSSSSSLQSPSNSLNNPILNREIENLEMTDPCSSNSPYVIIVRNLTKMFYSTPKSKRSICPPSFRTKDKNDRKAVLEQLFLGVKKNECFGYLGVNGAGKTTSLNILTGILKMDPTMGDKGEAWVGGYPVIPFSTEIKKIIGICPQHDLLFPTLTVLEHLRIFALIKNITPESIESHVEKVIEAMRLDEVRHVKSDQLSGGNKRRLSIAIACLGDPKVVILDEPTTGVDVHLRRSIWDSINRLKQSTSVILTTHSMEEAEELCSRIGILLNGSLACLGTPQQLRSQYGKGYKVAIKLRTGTTQQIESPDSEIQHQGDLSARADLVVKEILQKYVGRVVLRIGKNIDFEVWSPVENQSPEDMANVPTTDDIKPTDRLAQESTATDNKSVADFLGELFEYLEERIEIWDVEEWSVSQTNLEQVFVEFAKKQEKESTSEKSKTK